MRPWERAPLPKETIYDFLRTLVGRVPWRDEAEKLRYTELINRYEEVNIFGYMATKITTRMDDEEGQ